MLAAYLNQAMCCLKLNDFCATRDHCHKALEMDPKNEKGLFRMGQALLGIHEPEEAKKHLAILQFDSNNKAAANQVVICNAKIREQREKDKKLYSSIFNKMAENDRQKALRNKAMERPEPTQWDNEDSENTTAVELKDPLDSVLCTESEDFEGSDENY
ncbi:peptidyl-prolyl cis-trans isomerase FKBP4-like [Daphnia pulicaria]|uniref:peptidyl-prolyl cis-trans isomerase FKBP4-like n=1 Tax=Daphnia pulicaria TaxID=35523 RepID=UPI001EEB33A7|nr:peptidyl-prolyl cis-trans isomerase FKBP4-like [Daphnia pulicaria]